MSTNNLKLKYLLISIAVIITFATFYYTQNLVKELQKSEREIVELYAKSLEFIANSNSTGNEDFTFIFENIIKRINFPLILTDSNNVASIYQLGSSVKNIEIDSTLNQEQLQLFLNEKVKELSKIHAPITVTYKDSKNLPVILNKIYYGNSDVVQKLQYYPFLQILFALLFLTISYLSFSYLKKNEQSKIWVGMAKEIAHQLGTPISSLMGWVELLKLKYKKPEEVIYVANEMNSDLTRLNKITNRFSKIGSKPILKEKSISESIYNVTKYFERRLPQTGKDVELIFNPKKNIITKLNSELFEWVIENLVKNAIDAIGSSKGKIEIFLSENDNNIFIEVSDNGKGISSKHKKDIFKPGYSTKNRGWGLGLSLSKRIIDEYHKGKLLLKSSVQEEGTVFKITLPKT